MKNWTLAACLTLGLAALAGADDAPKPVNAKCPIMGGEAKATVTATWNGKTIGFCCKPCVPKWNALPEDQKAAELKASMTDGGGKPGAKKTVNVKCPIMGHAVKGTITTAWHGKTIGFCCPPCVPKWEALSEPQKAKKLAASMN